jgi:phosphodiesterase/alkaline phosphatase D-like protein
VGAGGTGLLAAVGAGALRAPAASAAARTASSGDGTPEQVHLTWGNDPATSVVVSWASPGRAVRPRVLLDRGSGGREVVSAHTRSYTDGLNGETVWTYHAVVERLRPDTGYSYVVTADNLRNGATPVRGSVRTAPAGRVPFRFTSFGDLATPNTQWCCPTGRAPTR